MAASAPASAQAGGDLQAQILYAWQTEDLNELHALQSHLRTQLVDAAGDSALHYHLAHADYRLARLELAANPREAALAATECVEQLKSLLKANGHNVEALVLQSRCHAQLAASGALDAMLERRWAAERLATALKIAPRNPRVLLVAALADLQSGGEAQARGRSELRAAAELFTASSATNPDSPGWGDVEAWVALGRELHQSGDALGARNWIERALIASPDDKDAQRARAELAGH